MDRQPRLALQLVTASSRTRSRTKTPPQCLQRCHRRNQSYVILTLSWSLWSIDCVYGTVWPLTSSCRFHRNQSLLKSKYQRSQRTSYETSVQMLSFHSTPLESPYRAGLYVASLVAQTLLLSGQSRPSLPNSRPCLRPKSKDQR